MQLRRNLVERRAFRPVTQPGISFRKALTTRMKSPLPVFVLILLFSHAPAVAADWVHVLLLSAESEVMSGPRHEMVRVMNAASPNTPMFDRIEVRTETDGFDMSRQQYSVRFYPSGWRETESGRRVHLATAALNRAELDLLIHQALVKRYLFVVNLLFDRKILVLKAALGVVLDDTINVLRQKRTSLDFDLDDLVEAESDRMQLTLERIELESSIGSAEDRIRAYTGTDGPLHIDLTRLPGIEMIETMMREKDPLADDGNVYLQNSRLEAELARSRYLLEASESRRYLRFFETAYDSQRSDDPAEAYSLQLGVRLPFVNPDRLDINRRHLGQLREKGRHLALRNELSERATFLSRDLNRLIKQHKILAQKRQEDRRSSRLDTYRQYGGTDPLILLRIKEIGLLEDVQLADTGRDLYTRYVEWLDLSGKLSEKPLKNYLSRNLEVLAP